MLYSSYGNGIIPLGIKGICSCLSIKPTLAFGGRKACNYCLDDTLNDYFCFAKLANLLGIATLPNTIISSSNSSLD